MKVFYFLRINITIGQSYPDVLQLVLHAIDIGIALCLCKMHGYCFLQFMQFPVGSLDLIYGYSHPVTACRRHLVIRKLRHLRQIACRLNDNPICAAIYPDLILLRMITIAQQNLRMILAAHPPLYHPVNPSALLHCIVGSSCSSIVNISGAQNKFNQAPN